MKTQETVNGCYSNMLMIQWINAWIEEEAAEMTLGILATVDHQCLPYTRTIAIREITEEGVLFFTQKGSQKVQHIRRNNRVSLSIVLPLHCRQITFHGTALSLSEEENNRYWEHYHKASQLRFMAYGPRSGDVIVSNKELDEALIVAHQTYETASPTRPESYIGYRILPTYLALYQLNTERISDAFVGNKKNDMWELQRVVP